MSQYDELLTKALSVRNNTSPASNTATLVGGVLVSIVSALSSIEEEIKEAGGGGITPEQFSQMLAAQITSYLEPYVKKAGDEITGSLLVDQELIANILKLRDSEGNVVTLTYDEGKLNIDKTIMSSEDIIAFGVRSTEATTILDYINETITANPLSPATADLDKIRIGNVIYNISGGDINWGGITGEGNGIATLTYDSSTKLLSGTRATFLTEHQDLSGKLDVGANAVSASKLFSSVSLWGNPFDGTSDISGAIKIGNTQMVLDKWSLTIQEGSSWKGDGWRLNSAFSGSDDSNKFLIETTATGAEDPSWGTALAITCKSRYVGIGTTSPSYPLSIVNNASCGLAIKRSIANSSVYMTFFPSNQETNFAYVGAKSNGAVFLGSKRNIASTARIIFDGGEDESGIYCQVNNDKAAGNARLNIRNDKGENRVMVGSKGSSYLAVGWEDDSSWSSNNVYLLNDNTGYTMLATTNTRNGATASRNIYLRPGGLLSVSGQLQLGTTTSSLSSPLTISYSTYGLLTLKRTSTNAGAVAMYCNNNQTTKKWAVGMYNNDKFGWAWYDSSASDVTKLSLDSNGNLVAVGDVTAYSDARLKSDIQDLEYRGELHPKSYIKDGRRCIGFVAQEVRVLYPELVHGEETEDSYLSLNYGAITAVLASENKELRKRIERLEELLNK